MAKDNRSSYPLRLADDVKAWVKDHAKKNSWSVNAEINHTLRQLKDNETQPTNGKEAN